LDTDGNKVASFLGDDAAGLGKRVAELGRVGEDGMKSTAGVTLCAVFGASALGTAHGQARAGSGLRSDNTNVLRHSRRTLSTA